MNVKIVTEPHNAPNAKEAASVKGRCVLAVLVIKGAQNAEAVVNKKRDAEYEVITIQILKMRGEIFAGAGMDIDMFDETYLDGLGDYERKLAKREGIELDDQACTNDK